MTTSRRTFIKNASSIGALAALPGWALAAGEAEKPLNLLILGGTGFIGPHEINYALARGHSVTMFNRGKTAPDMFPNVESLIGDRDGELENHNIYLNVSWDKGNSWAGTDIPLDDARAAPESARAGIRHCAAVENPEQRRFARARHTGQAGKKPQGDFNIDILEVVGTRTADLNFVHCLPADVLIPGLGRQTVKREIIRPSNSFGQSRLAE